MNENRSLQKFHSFALNAVAATAIGVFLAACGGTLPAKRETIKTYAVAADEEAIHETLSRLGGSDCGEACSAFMVLNRGEDALRWRLALVDNAKKSIDLQYYLWHADATGTLLLQRAIQAADRGVRVRILLDDTNILDSRRKTVVLNSHPNLEIRVFNPFVEGRSRLKRLFELVGNFNRLNHRMHNKLFVVDNMTAVVGGRNIGNEYFGMNEEISFRDMDLVTVGPVANQVSSAFDMYWNSDWALRPETLEDKLRGDIAPQPQEKRMAAAKKDYPKLMANIRKRLSENRMLLQSFEPAPNERDELVAQFKANATFGTAEIIADTPPTGEGELAVQVGKRIGQLMRSAHSEIFIVTPYLVPTERGVEVIRGHVDRGVKVRILTNSLASNDVLSAHAGYEVYREQLLEAGVELFELRADSPSRGFYNTKPVVLEYLGLHAKVVIVDRQKMFVGTMNFDPRAMIQNTEVGAIVHSPDLAADLLEAFNRDLQPVNSWRVHYDEDGFIQFTSNKKSTYLQPARNFWNRFKAWLAPGPAFEYQI